MANLFLWLHILSGLVAATLAGLLWRRRGARGASAVALLMLAIAIWALAYGGELASTDVDGMRFWLRIEYLGIATGPLCWLLFAIQYSGHSAWLTPRRLGALLTIPVLTILLNATNGWHGWYYAAVAVDRSGPFPLAALEPGPWYRVQVGYSLAVMLAGSLLLLRLWRQTARLFHPQLWIVLSGAWLPLAVNVAYLLGARPFGRIDLTPLTMTLTGMLVYWGVFRYRLFALAPIARNVLFEQLHDPVLVLDRGERVVDLNQAAQRSLGLAPGLIVGQARAVALARWPGLARSHSGRTVWELALTLPVGVAAVYEARQSGLTDQRGQPQGSMLVLHDITARRALEAEREALIGQLQILATTDSLTGIPNRGAFLEAAEQAWAETQRAGAPLALLLLDLDYFKAINDGYGHAAGDLVLQSVAACCRRQVRAGNTVAVEAVGWTARILQHEVDHLDGVMCMSKMDPSTKMDGGRYKELSPFSAEEVRRHLGLR